MERWGREGEKWAGFEGEVVAAWGLGVGLRDPCGGGAEDLKGGSRWGPPPRLPLSERTVLSSLPILLSPEGDVEIGLAVTEPLIVHRMTVGKTVAEIMTTETWTTAHIPESTAARRASMTMMIHPRSRVQR